MSRLAASYIYTDERDRPRLRKMRLEPKRFIMNAARYKNDRLYWKSGPRCVQRYQGDWAPKALYNLPVLMDALKSGDTVYIGEGERDCDTATALWKLPITTNWQGASRFTPKQAEWFVRIGRGRSPVRIFIDNDDPGHFAAWQRYQTLIGVGVGRKRVRLYRPASPGLKDPTDVALAGLGASAWCRVGVGEVEDRANAYAAEHPTGDERTSDWMRS